MVDLVSPPLVGKRYQLLNSLGIGGMGAVYTALDRLTGQRIALKRVTIPAKQLQLSNGVDTLMLSDSDSDSVSDLTPFNDSANVRLALTQEFRMLASLRHPNIISVLDYGFDEQANPYFTMELLENAQNVRDFGRDQDLLVQVTLLAQILQALAYLHRRGIIHRDLKAGNVLVTDDQVKVLDFGLSIKQDEVIAGTGTTLGTPAYMAPEILKGARASESSDLYAVGVLAYELFAGHRPFESNDLPTLVNAIINTPPDLTAHGIDRRLLPVLTKLLAKSPHDRYADASEVIAAFSQALGQSFVVENAATRESFLQSARLVGRDVEIAQLSRILSQAMQGDGSTWLIEGESGIGKSRLLGELRAIALAQGAVVLRGQAISEGGSLYHLWRPILRWMCLLTDLTPEEASVLKFVVPDIEALIEHDVWDAPELDPDAAQARLLDVIEAIFRRQRRPMLVVLEDLQWARSESLAVLVRLSRTVRDLRIFIAASYRSDESPELPAIFSEVQVFKLNRLNRADIAELSVAMLGKAGHTDRIVDLLAKETEGNAFFLVETVRALAEEAGQLNLVGQKPLPEHILTGKVLDIVKRRLERVPADARPLLQLAAVAGRELNLLLLRKLDPQGDMDGWLATCTNMAVLEVHEGNWHFAHDKLREGLLSSLPDAQLQGLHLKVAETIEAVYPDAPEQVAALAYHWRMAGNVEKEQHYSVLAGEQTLLNGAYREAITFLGRALTLAPQDTGQLERAKLTRQLADAHYGLGNLTESRDYLYQTLELLDYPLSRTRSGRIRAVPGEMIKHLWHQLPIYDSIRFGPVLPTRPVLAEAARACERLGQVHYLDHDKLGGLLTILRLLNLGEQIGPSPQLARSYSSGALASGILGLHSLAVRYSRLASTIANRLGQPLDVAYVSEVTGIYNAGIGQWAIAEQNCRQATEIFGKAGNWRWKEESLLVLAIVAHRQGDFRRSDELYKEVYLSAYRRSGIESQSWGLTGRLWSQLPLDAVDDSLALLEGLPTDSLSHADKMCVYVALAQVSLSRQDRSRARDLAVQAADLAMQAPPTAQYSFPGYSGLAEVCLALWENSADQQRPEREELRKLAQQACHRIQGFAGAFPAARPDSLLLQGLYEWLDGKQSRAHRSWQKCAALAEKLSMPYHKAQAHFQIARHLEAGDPLRKQHLAQAQEIFTRLGAARDVKRVQDMMDGA
ncbi:MAG TPA: protein kinase [Aggregatilineales bacterium]|nr:protein kinase [Aggregatilineales bacterium]